MADGRQNHDTSSGDTVVSQNPEEKCPVEAPREALEPAPETEQDTAAQHDVEDNAIEKKVSGEPLDRTLSQAQKMGTKKIVVVMIALCVSLPWSAAMRREM